MPLIELLRPEQRAWLHRLRRRIANRELMRRTRADIHRAARERRSRRRRTAARRRARPHRRRCPRPRRPVRSRRSLPAVVAAAGVRSRSAARRRPGWTATPRREPRSATARTAVPNAGGTVLVPSWKEQDDRGKSKTTVGKDVLDAHEAAPGRRRRHRAARLSRDDRRIHSGARRPRPCGPARPATAAPASAKRQADLHAVAAWSPPPSSGPGGTCPTWRRPGGRVSWTPPRRSACLSTEPAGPRPHTGRLQVPPSTPRLHAGPPDPAARRSMPSARSSRPGRDSTRCSPLWTLPACRARAAKRCGGTFGRRSRPRLRRSTRPWTGPRRSSPCRGTRASRSGSTQSI